MARRRNRPDDLSNLDVRPFVAAFQRLDRRMQIAVLVVAAAVGVVAAVLYFNAHRQEQAGRDPAAGQPGGSRQGPTVTSAPVPPDAADNLLLGNPSNASPDPADRDNYLMVKPYYALSYNDGCGTPNWVSWRTTASDLGDAQRKLEFDADVTLPRGFRRVAHRDYSGSGFDRGHMCPHGDRAANTDMSYATFVMTNIVPQAPNQNQKAWRALEEYARELVQRQGVRLYTVCGPAGRGGAGSNGPAQAVGRGANRVVVPAECWKVIVIAPETGGPGDPAAIGPDARVIAVVMPNDNAAVTTDDWARFRTSPADVERRTGYRFFDKLRPDVAGTLRAKVDDAYVPPPRPRQVRGAE